MAKQRFDSIQIKAHFDEHGFLVDRPIVARIGAQTYKTPFGDRVEFRPASEVFKDDSLNSFAGKPLTLGHVTVTPQNAKEVVVGACGGAGVPCGVGVEVPLNVYAESAIEEAKKKNAAQLSVGYTSEDIEKPGWGSNETGEYIFEEDMKHDEQPPEGWVHFDALQTNIKVNHIALVFRGRAGIAKLNLDSEQEFPYDSGVNSNKGEVKMATIKIDSVDVEVPEEVANHVAALNAEVATANGKADTLEAERDALQVQVDGIQEKIDAAVSQAKADAEELAQVIGLASDAGVKCDGLTTVKDVKIAFVKEVTGRDVAEKSDAYIEAAFDMAKESDNMAEQRQAIKGDAVVDKVEKEDSAPLNPNARLNKIK